VPITKHKLLLYITRYAICITVPRMSKVTMCGNNMQKLLFFICERGLIMPVTDAMFSTFYIYEN